MKNIVFKNLLLIGISAATLCGCGGEAKEIVPTSLYEGISLMTSKRNFSLDFSLGGVSLFSYIFTDNSIGVYNKEDLSYTDFYVSDSNGIFKVNYDEKSFVYSEYLTSSNGNKITNLWDNEIIPNMLGINPDDVVNDKKIDSLTIKNRDFKTKFITCVGFSSNDYIDIEYLKASFSINKGLVFNLKIYDLNYILEFTLKNINVSKNELADEIIKNKITGLIRNENSEDLFKMRDLLSLNNMTIDSYDVIQGGYYGQEWLTKDYWFTTWAYYGYVALRHKADPSDSSDVDAIGCFLFQASDEGIAIYSQPAANYTDITKFMHYPSGMNILQNLQYLHSGKYGNIESVWPFSGNDYYLSEPNLVNDVLKCFSLDRNSVSSDSIFYYATPLAIQFDIYTITQAGNKLSDDKCEVNLIYIFNFEGETAYMPIPLKNFGAVSIPNFDAYIAELNNF